MSVYMGQDNAFIVKNFTTGSDTFIVLTDTPEQGCLNYDVLIALGELQWQLDQLPIVHRQIRLHHLPNTVRCL